MHKGRYIVIEGAEGTGKTTMVNLIAEQIRNAGLPVKILREPDSQNDVTARELRRLLLDPRYPMSTRTEVLLFNAARVQSLDFIRDAVANGIYCLVDRSYLSTLANQYYGRGDIDDYDRINQIIDFAVGDMQPDLMLVLDAPVPVLRERLSKRPSHGKFSHLDEGFYERVRAGYLWEAKQRNLPVVYANEGIETVFKHVWQHVSAVLALRNGGAGDSAKSGPQSVAEVLAANPPAKAAAVEPPLVGLTPPTAGAEPAAAPPAGNPTAAAAAKPGAALTADAPAPDAPWTQKHDNGSVTTTDAGRAELAKFVTDSEGDVYGFTQQLSPITIAAAMARLSRRGDDMRVTLLDEFIGKADKDAQLLQRVITAYGDDSVQQLAGQHIVIENASQLLTKKLEWGRLAAYLEQSTRYIYFDQKDAKGRYRYYIPDDLKGELRTQYVSTLDQIFDLYSRIVAGLTAHIRANSSVPAKEQDPAWRSATKAQACDAARPLLPVATKATVGMYASGQALESLIMHLLSDELPEARTTGQRILTEARRAAPVFLERTDKPDRGGAIIAYRAQTHQTMRRLAAEFLPPNHTPEADAVTLTDYTPRNELDVVADMLYEHSDLPLQALRTEVAAWPYQRKLDVFTAYMGERLNRRHRPGRALEKIHYSFDLVCDYGIFRDLQRHRMVDDLEWQALSPRYGYDIPPLVEEAGLAELFEQCFDLSLQLYSALQSAGKPLEAQYATLLGHKMRWKVTYNAREAFHLHELRTSPQGHPGYRKLVQQMHEKVAEVHPILAEAMRFVNQGEDPELTRLAAERYTAFKLAQLDGTDDPDTADTDAADPAPADNPAATKAVKRRTAKTTKAKRPKRS